MAKRIRNRNLINLIEIGLILIGLLIISISFLTWVPHEESEIVYKLNFLSLTIGILYILFAIVLRKLTH